MLLFAQMQESPELFFLAVWRGKRQFCFLAVSPETMLQKSLEGPTPHSVFFVLRRDTHGYAFLRVPELPSPPQSAHRGSLPAAPALSENLKVFLFTVSSISNLNDRLSEDCIGLIYAPYVNPTWPGTNAGKVHPYGLHHRHRC